MSAKDFLPKPIPAPTTPAPRQSINLMPGYLQTSALKKFFGITLDQLIQPAQQENVSGYIGEKGGLYYNPATDFYLQEPTPSRNNYQLEPTATSIDNNNKTNFVEFYQDIINSLEFDGALVNNHSRLFAEEYYSWSPPINPDMFVNFTNYFWVQVGPAINIITAPTNAVLDIIGQTNYSLTTCLGTVTNPTFNIGDPITLNGITTACTGTTLAQTVIDLGNNSTLVAAGIVASVYNNQLQISLAGTSLTIAGEGAIDAGLTQTNVSTLSLMSGMKVSFVNDANTEYNVTSYIVEGVGTSITLIDDSLFDNTNRYDIPGYDTTPYDGYAATTTPQYWTIRRGSQDGNPWSRNNRWFHKDVLGQLNIENTVYEQATLPIIEFLPNIELRNFARYAREDVTLWSTTDTVLDIVGQSSYRVDGVLLEDGNTILITADPDPSKNNRVYEVFGLEAYGKIGLSVVYDGLDPTGAPVSGEGVKITNGLVNIATYPYFNGTTWTIGQQKLLDNQPPIYNLYDLSANRLDSPTEYPGSNFNGSQIFSYTPSGTTIDETLGIDLTYDVFGDIGFTDFLTDVTYTYTSNNTTTNISGYYFYRQFTTPGDLGQDNYLNDWHKSTTPSRQLVHDEWIITPLVDNLNAVEYQLTYQLSIAPDVSNSNLPFNRRVYLNGQILNENVDYTISGSTLSLSETLALSTNDILEAETFAQTIPELLSNGYFEIPSNLSSNPNNQQITQRSFNEIAPQLISIIQNQTSLTGSPNGLNNYLDTARDLSRGQLILNHVASLLRVALLTGNPSTKLTDSMRYNNQQYNAFYNKFLIKLQQFINQGYTSSDSTNTWISGALTQINLGKTTTFPFSNSATYAIGNDYIPATAASLGVTPVYLPQMYLDDTKLTPVTVIQGHDGSIHNAYGDYRDDVILAFETDIYNNIDPSYINPDRILEFDQFTIIPGYFRSTDYSRNEFITISQPGFERYAVRQRVDYVQNRTYDPSNNLTWNYGKVQMPNGQLAPGHWRGIFLYFYDTYRPHTRPWEMLGFSQQPSWWEATYGPAPYTSNNVYLWTDLENGTIRNGARAGTYAQYARPGLKNLIPVDGQGNLLDPISIGLVTSSPNVYDAQANWKFGDSGPIEFQWRISSSFPYDLSEALYLAKPARFVDTFWEARKLARDQGQLYDIDLGRRFGSADLYVHNEVLTDGSQAVVKGISNWISDYLASMNMNIATAFGDLERDLNVELGYKAGSFIKNDTLRLNSDSFGLVPSENISVNLYKGASIAQPIYSAVMIIWDGSTYRVTGYDSIDQTFTIIPGEETGIRQPVTVNGVTVYKLAQNSSTTQSIPYYSSLPSRQAVYNFMIGYQAWLESQGWVFDDYDTVNKVTNDFVTAASNFLIWSSRTLNIGDSIIFSPSSDHLVYTYKQGHVENIGQYVNGVYGVLDRTGYGINTNQFDVTRSPGQFEVTLKDTSVQGIYCLRLSLVEYEHILLLDNTTDFGVLIYDPVLGIRQARFQLFANRTMFWNGEPLAAGFIVQNDDLTDNFETSVDNFRRFYDFDINPSTGVQNELAQHTIGYQERTYLDNLLLDTQTEFDYYKGFIGAKGTLPSFNNILRSTYITKTAGFTILEEWAFLIGQYGNVERKSTFELQLRQSDFTTNPQLVEFVDTVGTNPTYIDMVPNDIRWVLKNQSNQTNNQFSLRDFTNKYRKDLPTAGYVQVNETTYTILNTTALTDVNTGLFTTVINTNSSRFNEGDTIWQILLDNGDWNVYRVCQDVQLASIEIGVNPSDPTVITTVGNHTLLPGDTIFFQDPTQTSPDLQGVETVLNTHLTSATLTTNQFSIADTISTGFIYPSQSVGTVVNPVFSVGNTIGITVGSNAEIIVTLTGTGLTQTVADINAAFLAVQNTTTTASATQDNTLQISDSTALTISIDITTQGAINAGLPASSVLTGINVYVLKSVRFATPSAASAFTPPLGWLTNDKVFIDNNGINLWEVQQYNGTSFITVRTETDKINIDSVYTSYIYDNITNQDVIQCQLYDPGKGLIFSSADTQISYKVDYDPAYYNSNDDSSGSGSSGAISSTATLYPQLAWGENQVGQLWWDLSTTRFLDYEQGTLDYRKKNWGALAPGVVVDIYEWVESPVPPSGWDAYVLAQANSGPNAPTGTVPLEEETPYVTVTTFDASKDAQVINYYFWVLTPTTIPAGIPGRTSSAFTVSQLIGNATGQDIVWFAPIAPNAFIINNAETFINNSSSVLQVVFYECEDESIIHKQWILGREFDEVNPIYSGLVSKMTDSLVGFDGLGLSVPDPTLSPVIKYGNSIRPRQTWFMDRLEARLEFFQKANSLLILDNVTSITGWNDGLTASSPLPPASSYDYTVTTRADRNLLDNNITFDSVVLVEQDEQLNGAWSLWTYLGGSNWQLIEQEQYDATDYWEYADWYATGYSSSTQPDFTFADISIMNANASEFAVGDIIKVENNGAGNWALYLYTLDNSLPEFTVIGQQNGTIQFLPTLSNYDPSNTALDLAVSTVTKTFIAALQNNLLSVLEFNELFFSMVHYVHFEQTIVPWAFKTSMLYGQGQLIPFATDYILPADETDDLVSFFQEAKPYHVKLRTLTEQRRNSYDEADVKASDTYLFDISLIFDRVSLVPAPAGQTPTAANRIQEYYAPTEGMPPKVLAALISRGEFAGTILDGKNFYQFGTKISSGYDLQPLDDNYLGGYDFSDANILSQINPVWNIGDTLIINGVTVTMTGTSVAQASADINASTQLNTMGIFASEVLTPVGTGTGYQLQITDRANIDLSFGGSANSVTGFNFPATVTNQELTPSTLENFYDVFVNGGSPLGTPGQIKVEVPETASTINVDGNQLIQPYLDANHPEELVTARVGDAIIIDVYTYDTELGSFGYDSTGYDTEGYDTDGNDVPGRGIRFPKQRIKNFIGDGTTTTFAIGQLPQNRQALFVWLNGRLLTINKDYTVDWDLANVIMNVAPLTTDTLNISSFGVGGGIINKKRTFKNTSATTFNMNINLGAEDQVFVMVDGQLATFTVSGTSVIITSPIPNNSTVLIVSFKGTSYSTILTQAQTTATSGTFNFNVTRPASSDIPPELTTDVYKNELRLNPPPMKVYTMDNVTTVFDLPTINNPNAVTTAVNAWVDGTPLQSNQFSYNATQFTFIGTPVIGEILLIQCITDDSDYTINTTSGEVVEIVNVNAGDVMLVTTYSEDNSFQMYQESVYGASNNTYSLGIKPTDTNSLNVYLNGQFLTFGKDFKLVDPSTNYDSDFEKFDGIGYTNAKTISIVITGAANLETDKITVMYFTQFPAQDPIGLRMYKNIFGNYEFFRISDANSTTLTAVLQPTDNVVVVNDATVLGQPSIVDANNNPVTPSPEYMATLTYEQLKELKYVNPGVVFINGERIVFWLVDTTTPGAHQLIQCLRGTGGTGINIEVPVGGVVRDASKNQIIPGNSWNWQYTPNGLQYSTDPQAEFLQESSGSPDFGS